MAALHSTSMVQGGAIPAPKHGRVMASGRAFPHLKIELDASVGPLSFLGYRDRARTEAVSRQFLAETRAPPLWEEFVVDKLDEGQVDDAVFFFAVLRKIPRLASLKRIDIGFDRCSLTHASFSIIAAGCPALKVLRLSALTREGLREIADGCPRLEELHLRDTSAVLTDEVIAYAVARFPLLSVFRICPSDPDDGFQLTDATVLALATHCRSLRELELWHARLSDETLIALANNCPLLSILDVQSCDPDQYEGDTALTDAFLIAVAERCPLLKELNVGFCSGISSAGIVAIARHCPLLEILSFDDCINVGDDAVRVVAENCPLVWNVSCNMPFEEVGEEFTPDLSWDTFEWLNRHVPYAPERPPGRLAMKELLVAHPPPW